MLRARRSERRRRQPPTPEGSLGALPAEVQDNVLARLPARDVVRTSVLSPVWRHRWESVPDLDVDIDIDGVRSWETAVSVLERCANPVRRVSIRGVPLGLAGRADNWLRLVAGKSPRSVSLDLPARDTPAALPSLFSCDPAALAELRLRSCALPAPPVGFAGFHALAALSLDRVLFHGENGWRQVEAMLAAAPGLQELSLKHIVFHVADVGSIPGKWVIGGPNLRRLVLCLSLVGAGSWELGDLPKLEDADVMLNDSPVDRDYDKLFRAVSRVRELKLGNFDGVTYQGPFLTSLLFGFQNLRVLKLDTNFSIITTFVSTFYLLRRAQLLQVLEITNSFRDEEIFQEGVVAGFMLSVLPNSTLWFKNLEYLRMINISCSENEMRFIRHVLHRARNLRAVSVDMFEGSTKTAQEASRELKECQRASPAARISIKHGDSVCNV